MTAPEKRPSSVSFAFNKLRRSKRALLITCASVIAAAMTYLANVWTPLETVTSSATEYYKKYQYLNTLRSPYPSVLDEKEVATWPPGKTQLAIFQIQGYLGQLRTSPNWIKQCLTNTTIFPDSSQFNDRFETAPSGIDRQNLIVLQRAIEASDLKLDFLLRTTDIFHRLLERSEKQLLYRYHDSEISKLDLAELYLLRNAIFARHGRSFDTEKLEKFANRNGWPSSDHFQISQMPAVELCNGLYLNELHAARELGALGRGILIRNNYSVAATSLLKASVCTCLSQPKAMVNCRQNSAASNQDEFRDYVDLIVEFNIADKNTADWTYIDPRYVASADLSSFKAHMDSFLSSSVEFNSGIQLTLGTRNFSFATSGAGEQGAFWGTRVSFTKATYDALASDPTFLKELSANMCATLHDSLEVSGQYVPRVVKPPALVPVTSGADLKIVQKPIVFDDRRMNLTLEYMQKHFGESVPDINLRPRMIVLHRTNIDTLDDSYEALRPSTVAETGKDAQDPSNARLNSSVHYLVDKEGTIYSLMRDFYIARHVVGLDQIAIGISNVGASESSMTDAQLRADELLIRFLKERNDDIVWLVAASEADKFRGSGLWEEMDVRYREPDFDPGKKFVDRLRELLQKDELNLKPPP
jgi:N-acetylmuramoyl-L-alanine amidase